MRIHVQVLFLFIVLLLHSRIVAQIPMEGLSLWLKTGSSVKVEGSNVLAWADESGNHHDAITVSTSKPLLIPNELNGHSVIRFNGKDNYMQTVPFATFKNKRGTVLIVFKLNGPSFTSGAGVSTLLSTYLGNGITWQLCASEYVYIYYDGVGADGMPLAAVAKEQWELAALMRTDDTSMTIYRKSDPKTFFPVTNNQPDSNRVKIGSNGRLEVLNGDIAEIIVYNRALSVNEFEEVNEYLALKYKIEKPAPHFTETSWFYLLIAITILLCAIAITKYLAQRKLKRKLEELKKQAQLDKERQRISREMHDDIGAGLTQIVLMSEFARNKNAAGTDKELEDIATTSRKLVSNMGEIIWSLNPENKTLDQLYTYMREQLNKQLEYSGIDNTIELPENASNILLSNEQRRNILLVTKELVNNAIKYSEAKNISINSTFKKGEVNFTVQDDGIGFDVSKLYSGNGLKNIKSRIQELGGKLHINSVPGKGSSFTYFIPLHTTT